jgi:hypothetical protein
LGFEEALTAPWSDEREVLVSVEELRSMFPPGTMSAEIAQRAVSLGVLAPDRDAFRVPSPRLLRIGAELVELGVPLDAALDVLAELRSDTGRLAQLFVGLFERHVWGPFREAGMPAERLSEVTEKLRRLRPLASAAVGAALAQAMEAAVGRAAVRHVEDVRDISAPAST